MLSDSYNLWHVIYANSIQFVLISKHCKCIISSLLKKNGLLHVLSKYKET